MKTGPDLKAEQVTDFLDNIEVQACLENFSLKFRSGIAPALEIKKCILRGSFRVSGFRGNQISGDPGFRHPDFGSPLPDFGDPDFEAPGFRCPGFREKCPGFQVTTG